VPQDDLTPLLREAAKQTGDITLDLTVTTYLPALETDVLAIQEAAKESKLSDDDTIGQLIADTGMKIELPFVKEHVDARDAFFVISLAALASLLLLISLAESIRIMLRKQRLLDWLPVHPGGFAALIGSSWIALPAILAIYGILNDFQNVANREGVFLPEILSAATVWLFFRVRGIRRLLYENFLPVEKHRSASEELAIKMAQDL
jgi:hypothetical protein